MLGKKSLLSLAVVASTASIMSILPGTAYADYAPSSGDVVGVGSDTLQQLGDFVADGDVLGQAGYNSGKKNKFISIDATADANSRLAYGTAGSGSVCAPGTGGTQGTGNQNTTHPEASAAGVAQPCTLNPTVILRQGQSPVQRPNGSGAGFNLLKADTNASTGAGVNGLVDFARASSSRTSGANFDSVQIGSDPLAMLTSSTSNNKNTLSIAQLKSIYSCAATDWATISATNTAGTIVPLLPQLGSGTRSFFVGQIGLTEATLGTCVKNVEENDPEAIDSSGSPANAVEPMSQSRLFLYQGKLASGASNGVGGYFRDPSCIGLSTNATCVSTPTLNPNVKLWNTTDSTLATDGGATYYPTRPLYIYFRHADQASTKKFQPGDSRNWVQTMLNNPGGVVPYFCSAAGAALISSAGVTPACTFTLAGP